jgi:hypothetical protein
MQLDCNVGIAFYSSNTSKKHSSFFVLGVQEGIPKEFRSAGVQTIVFLRR